MWSITHYSIVIDDEVELGGSHRGEGRHYFIVMVGVHVLQSICTVALDHSREKTPEPAVVSAQIPRGSP